MTNEEFVGNLLAPYEPQRSLSQLVLEVNRIYHTFEARDYDVRHPEIAVQLPPVWHEMVHHALSQRPMATWRILDFGCGTGFEAEQLLRNLPTDSVAQLVCYDPSPEMLARCRERIAPLYPQAIFTSDLADVPSTAGGYNLLATNSLLHHLPEPVSTIKDLLPMLSADAVWLAGHEPSRRFFANKECMATYRVFSQDRKWRRFLDPGTYVTRIEIALRRRSNPTSQTAKEAYRQQLFNRLPPPWLIGRLVDFYVAFSPEEALSGRGLDHEQLALDFAGLWSLTWVKSYGFMGLFYDGDLPGKWARLSRHLKAKYPLDGSNFCAVWSRSET